MVSNCSGPGRVAVVHLGLFGLERGVLGGLGASGAESLHPSRHRKVAPGGPKDLIELPLLLVASALEDRNLIEASIALSCHRGAFVRSAEERRHCPDGCVEMPLIEGVGRGVCHDAPDKVDSLSRRWRRMRS